MKNSTCACVRQPGSTQFSRCFLFCVWRVVHVGFAVHSEPSASASSLGSASSVSSSSVASAPGKPPAPIPAGKSKASKAQNGGSFTSSSALAEKQKSSDSGAKKVLGRVLKALHKHVDDVGENLLQIISDDRHSQLSGYEFQSGTDYAHMLHMVGMRRLFLL